MPAATSTRCWRIHRRRERLAHREGQRPARQPTWPRVPRGNASRPRTPRVGVPSGPASPGRLRATRPHRPVPGRFPNLTRPVLPRRRLQPGIHQVECEVPVEIRIVEHFAQRGNTALEETGIVKDAPGHAGSFRPWGPKLLQQLFLGDGHIDRIAVQNIQERGQEAIALARRLLATAGNPPWPTPGWRSTANVRPLLLGHEKRVPCAVGASLVCARAVGPWGRTATPEPGC